ncbi:MAG: DUF4388 domain-containing protein [Planctomycetota bacterium]
MLKGNISDVNLADIFQIISMGKKEGTLTISSGIKKVHIYFGKDTIRLLSEGEPRHTLLGDSLVIGDKISPTQLVEALAEQAKSRKPLGQILVEMGLISAADVEECLRKQVEEEICDIFIWENAEFEFISGLPSPELCDTMSGIPLSFNVSGILFEATRRADEWMKLVKEIESAKVAFEVRNKADKVPDPTPFGFSKEQANQIVNLLNDVHTVDEITGRAPLSRLQVCRLLVFLLKKNYITKVSSGKELPADFSKHVVEEVTKYAAQIHHASPVKHVTDADWHKEMNWEVEDSELRAKIDVMYWGSKTKEEAAKKITDLADNMLMNGQLDESVPVFNSALQIFPGNMNVRSKLVHLYVLQWKFGEAARILVDGYKFHKD